MKTYLRSLPPLLALALAFPVLVRADEKVTSSPEAGKKEMRRVIISRHGDSEVEKEPTTFLGVSTQRADATLTEHLGLAEGMGLVVNAIVPDSPAAGALKRHDVLLKLNDQLLIDPYQLAVLIRSFKEGDEVTFTYVRGGKQATAKVKLTQRDLPKVSVFERELAPPGFRFEAAPAVGVAGFKHRVDTLPRGEVDHVLAAVGPGGGPFTATLTPGHPLARMLAIGNSNLLFSDDEGSLEIKSLDGKKELTAKDKDGKVLFSGPINTPEERKALPDAVRMRLDRLESTDHLQFRTDEEFREGEINVVVPRARTTSLPAARFEAEAEPAPGLHPL